MALARKKIEETNLKSLREFAALPENKFCFDCNQRGPTYVNVTIGSLVCTKCSGILRGLTPPHRVKSISMASFTLDEIETIKNRGNNLCRKIWMGLYEGESPNLANESHVRDFMIEKYEKKRYYLDEKNAFKMTNNNSSSMQNNWKQPETNNGLKNGLNLNNNNKINSANLNGKSRSRPEIKINQNNQIIINNNNNNNNNNTTSFIADFDKAEIFSNNNTSASSISSGSSSQNGFIADFEHNQVYSASSSNSNNDSSNATPNNSSWTNLNGSLHQVHPIIIQEDKYAALKDLDNEMKQQHALNQPDIWSSATTTNTTGSSSSLYSSSTNNGSLFGESSSSPQGSIFGSPSQQSQFINGFNNNNNNNNNLAMQIEQPQIQIGNPFGGNNNLFNNNNNQQNFNFHVPQQQQQQQQILLNPFKDPFIKTNNNGIFSTNNNNWNGNPFKVSASSSVTNNPFL